MLTVNKSSVSRQQLFWNVRKRSFTGVPHESCFGKVTQNSKRNTRKGVTSLKSWLTKHGALLNQFHAFGLFRIPWKQQFFWCFQEDRKKPVAWHGLKKTWMFCYKLYEIFQKRMLQNFPCDRFCFILKTLKHFPTSLSPTFITAFLNYFYYKRMLDLSFFPVCLQCFKIVTKTSRGSHVALTSFLEEVHIIYKTVH